MDEHTQQPPPSQPEPEPRRPRRRRRARPNGRWSNPASPLQAARFDLRLNGLDVIAAIRRICPGHGGEPCKIDVAKLSDYETRNRRMGLTHVEAFARFYQRSPEELGLINWRNAPGEPAPWTQIATVSGVPCSRCGRDPAQEHLVLDWLRDGAVTVATAVLQTLATSPLKAAPAQETPTGLQTTGGQQPTTGQTQPPDENPPDEDPRDQDPPDDEPPDAPALTT